MLIISVFGDADRAHQIGVMFHQIGLQMEGKGKVVLPSVMGKELIATNHKHQLSGFSVGRENLVADAIGCSQTVPVQIQNHTNGGVGFHVFLNQCKSSFIGGVIGLIAKGFIMNNSKSVFNQFITENTSYGNYVFIRIGGSDVLILGPESALVFPLTQAIAFGISTKNMKSIRRLSSRWGGALRSQVKKFSENVL